MPLYRVVDRRLWTGARHTDLHATLVDLARNVWRARRVVVDATGIGAGLASWLAAALPGLVVPWVFTAHAKSDLGWRLLAAIDGGRLKDYADDGAEETRLFWRQVEACSYELRPGPGKLLAWGVDDPRTHDDLLLSLALVGALDDEDWRPRVARGSGGWSGSWIVGRSGSDEGEVPSAECRVSAPYPTIRLSDYAPRYGWPLPSRNRAWYRDVRIDAG